jgi:hypothetical protein
MLKSDSLTIISMMLAGMILTVAALEVRDTKMLTESYKESAYQSMEMAESCAAELESALLLKGDGNSF